MSDQNPYGQNPGDPNPYGQPAGGYGQPAGGYGAPIAQPHPKSTTILILGIVSLVCCSLLGPVAWIMGKNTVAEIDASGGALSGRESANIGKILGIVATALLVLGVVGYGIAAIIGLAANA